MSETPETDAGALGDRQSQVLRAIVREFIRTAEPVGSKHLVGRFHMHVSSATVRNDMAFLEELGYLSQPHTSAGRVPTELAYRFYVAMESPSRLPMPLERQLEEAIASEPGDLDGMLLRASEALARLTRYATAVLTPRLGASRLKHIDLTWLGPRLVVIVLIAEGGRIEKRAMELDADVTSLQIGRVERELNARLVSMRMDQAELAVTGLADSAQPGDREVYAGVAGALAALLQAEQRVVVGGAAHLADEGAIAGRETLRRIYEIMDSRSDLLTLLDGAERPASVRIGSDLPMEELRSCSVVVSPYGGGAAVGVIGPTRMEYLRTIAAVSLVARILDDAIRALAG